MRTLAIRILQETANETVDAEPANVHDAHTRRRLSVERARRYVWEHLDDPIRLADLCACAHLQARSLEYGFRELVKLAPMAYVRMLRLGEVHAQLLADSTEQRSISEIALDAGFSHLSQFVVDYKKVFGETPSATRRNVVSPVRIEPIPRTPTAAMDAASRRHAPRFASWRRIELASPFALMAGAHS